MSDQTYNPSLRESATFGRDVIGEIQRAAETGIYDIRGWGAKRKVPHFDDLLFLGASMSAIPSRATGRSVAPRWCSVPASPRSRWSLIPR